MALGTVGLSNPLVRQRQAERRHQRRLDRSRRCPTRRLPGVGYVPHRDLALAAVLWPLTIPKAQEDVPVTEQAHRVRHYIVQFSSSLRQLAAPHAKNQFMPSHLLFTRFLFHALLNIACNTSSDKQATIASNNFSSGTRSGLYALFSTPLP